MASDYVFGNIEGVEVGDWWQTLDECRRRGVHGTNSGGISGSKEVGCPSVVLIPRSSFQDEDRGETFTYIGSGGKAPGDRHGEQVDDQSPDNNRNLCLELSAKLRKPVRVIRGPARSSKVECSRYATSEGYRYDGLYEVSGPTLEIGDNGLQQCRFEFKRLPGQAPLPIDIYPAKNVRWTTDELFLLRESREQAREQAETRRKAVARSVVGREETRTTPLVENTIEQKFEPVQNAITALRKLKRGASVAELSPQLMEPILTVGRHIASMLQVIQAQQADIQGWRQVYWAFVLSKLPPIQGIEQASDIERLYKTYEQKRAQRNGFEGRV